MLGSRGTHASTILGLSSASEIYQYVIQQVLQGIPGAQNISDDIIVFGKDQESYDQQLEITLAPLAERGLTLNRERCVFSVPELVFFGHKVSAAGISPDKKKVDAVKHARAPQSISELRGFLGLANYCARYISHFATIVEPLCILPELKSNGPGPLLTSRHSTR